MSAPHYWQEAKEHLMRDKKLGCVIKEFDGEYMEDAGSPFYTLIRSITGQQISVKAADSIWGRVEALLPEMLPEAFLELGMDELRSCGLSQQKAGYMRNIAEGFVSRALTPEHWPDMDDDKVAAQLVGIKGIGRWTADMFLMFHLQRPDVWPVGDLGLVKAVDRLLKPKSKMDTAKLIKVAEPWRPYRTVAAWYLWRSLDPVPVQY